MSKNEKKRVFLEFKDGIAEYLKLIELNDGSIKLVYLPSSTTEWSLHPNRTHLKKKNLAVWHNHNPKEKYLHINYCNLKDAIGFFGLEAPLYLNGLFLSRKKPNPKDFTLKTSLLSTQKLWIFIGYGKGTPAIRNAFIKKNKIEPLIEVPFKLTNILVGIWNK